jgi:hypothetical protein
MNRDVRGFPLVVNDEQGEVKANPAVVARQFVYARPGVISAAAAMRFAANATAAAGPAACPWFHDRSGGCDWAIEPSRRMSTTSYKTTAVAPSPTCRRWHSRQVGSSVVERAVVPTSSR